MVHTNGVKNLFLSYLVDRHHPKCENRWSKRRKTTVIWLVTTLHYVKQKYNSMSNNDRLFIKFPKLHLLFSKFCCLQNVRHITPTIHKYHFPNESESFNSSRLRNYKNDYVIVTIKQFIYKTGWISWTTKLFYHVYIPKYS